MSEYQYYEFQAVDRPLTEEEQAIMRRLSSRVVLTSTSAAFTYNYGDFRGNPEQVLAQYFDAMLYVANWGSRHLMFRFPKALINLKQLEPYCAEDLIFCSAANDYAFLKLKFSEEEGGGWIDGEGRLPSLVRLRQDILQGDYRLLYLAWLKAITLEDTAEFAYEPPVPAGLNQLSPALRDFIELFEIDEALVQAAAQTSTPLVEVPADQLREVIRQLSREESDAWLLRLAQGEAHVSIALNRRLQELADLLQSKPQPRRTVGQLLRVAEQLEQEAEIRRAQEAEANRIKELKALAQRETQTWQEIEALIQRSQSKTYDEAVQLLLKLRDLAIYQGQESTFQQRLNYLYNQYHSRSSLLKRLRQVGLYSL